MSTVMLDVQIFRRHMGRSRSISLEQTAVGHTITLADATARCLF